MSDTSATAGFPTADHLEELVAPCVASHGLDIERIRIHPAGANTVVGVDVDGDKRPDLDTIEVLTEEISAALDAAEAAGKVSFGPGYTLEVGTPGLDMPLTRLRHFARQRGRLVQVTSTDPAVNGLYRLGEVTDSEAVLVATSVGAKGRLPKKPLKIVPREAIVKATVEVDFGQPREVEVELCALTVDEARARL